ncbi:MAG: APC family permease [Chloroflexi bacterium]|nr:APC family permease [Chloroflexota bacterium]
MIGGRRPLKGRKVGDRRVKVERPHSPYFRYLGPGQLVAREAASQSRTSRGRALSRLRAAIFGRPLSNEAEMEERLSKRKALAIFSSDAISSSAYATEEILRVLVVAGAGALLVSVQVAIAIALLLAVVSVSYRQVCRAYPNGGGAYIVARTNLAPVAGLIAAAALLIDYVMTVAVSTASAIAQIQSVIPAAYDVRIEIAFVSITLIMVANLRGLRESGNIFAIPTYLFVGLALAIVGIGAVRIATGSASPVQVADDAVPFGTESLGILLLLKAFAGGSVALTGVEAIANGVPAFKPPEARNAANTMTVMAVLLGVLFIGLTVLPWRSDFGRARKVDRPSWRWRHRRHSAMARHSSTHSRRARRSSCFWPRTRASTPFRAWPRSSPRTATCPGSSRSAVTAWPIRGESRSWRRSHSASCGPLAATPTPSSRSTRLVSSCASP